MSGVPASLFRAVWGSRRGKAITALVMVAVLVAVTCANIFSAFAATTWSLHPTGMYTANAAWTWSSSATTDLRSNDGDATRGQTTTAASWLYMNLDQVDTNIAGTINSVTVYYRMRKDTGNTATARMRVRTGTTNGTTVTGQALTDTYALYSITSTARPAGGAWTWADINTLNAGIQIDTGTTGTLSITEMYVVVDYTPAFTSTVAVTDGAVAIASAAVARSQAVAVDSFRLQRTVGTQATQVWTMTVRNPGTTPASTVAAVDIYRDANANGVYDAGTDTKLNTTSGVFTGTDADVLLTAAEAVDGTLRTYFVVYTFSATAADAATASAQLVAMTTNTSNVTGVPPTAGNTFTVDVNNPTAVVTAPTTNFQYTTASPGTITGTAADSVGVASVAVSIQRTGDNWYWNGGTSTWAAAQTWNPVTSGTTSWSYTWNFNPANQTGTPSYTIIARATDGVAHTGNSASITGVTISNSSTVVTVGNGTNPAAAFVARSQSVAVDAFTMQRSGSKASTVSAITIRNGGTAPATNVSAVDIYRDANANGTYDAGTDTKLNTTSGTFTGTDAPVTLTAAEAVDATLRTYFVVYTFAAGATDGATATALVQAMTTANVDTLAGVPATAGNIFTVDAVNPTVAVTAPAANNAVITGAGPYSVTGTSGDARSGVGAVAVTIQRTGDNLWWDQAGGVWTSTQTWNPATTANAWANWTASWTFNPANQNGSPAYVITARATDVVGNTNSAGWLGITIDNTKPTIVSATPVDSTHVDVLFSENLTAATANTSTNYSITGPNLAVSAAALQADNKTVRLTVATQDPGTLYTITVNNVTDAAGNAIVAASTTTFTGFGTKLRVQSVNQPAAAYVVPGAMVWVDGFTMSRVAGATSFSAPFVTVRDSGAVGVSGVRIYQDNGDNVYTVADTLMGTGTFTGTDSVVSLIPAPIFPASDGTKYWIVYVISGTAANGAVERSAVFSVSSGATALDNQAVAGNTFTVDASGPTVAVTAPAANNAALTAAGPYTVTGTAVDTGGSGVSAVAVSIQRSGDNWYWNAAGSTWAAGQTWNPASTANAWADWTMSWAFSPAGQNGSPTYTLIARAIDNVANTTTATRTGITVDNTPPTIVSATALSATSVDVVFSEALQSGSIAASDFAMNNGLTVSAAVLQADNKTVRLTTSTQGILTAYTLTIDPGVGHSVLDLAGNANVLATKGFTGFGVDATAPTVPGSVAVSVGVTEPTIARVTWTASTDNVAVTGYRVWRSTTLAGTYASIGTTTTTAFADTSGVTGQAYYYKVSAYDAAANESAPSAAVGPVTATWTPSPHTTYTATSMCKTCHKVHVAATYQGLFTALGSGSGEAPLCYACHDGSGSTTNIKTGATNSFALRSGHTLESLVDTTTPSDLTNACSACHSPHMDFKTRPVLWRSTINSVTRNNVTGQNNTWCLACHNDAQDWYVQKYGTAYPALAAPTRDASGYPVFGTFPGASVYNDSAKNAHVLMPASTSPDVRVDGDCLYCHAAHRGPSKYDSLLTTYGPSTTATVADDRANGTYAASCFACHDTGQRMGAPDIKSFATYLGAQNGENSGHRIKSIDASLPVNAPLPCYECHNPHGSSRGNASMISDTLGANLSTAAGPAGVRRFCLTCHSTSDATPYGWDSVGGAYAVVNNTMKVAGLGRAGGGATSGPDGGYNWLRLKVVNGHAMGDAQSCYQCHMNDYGVEGYNVHRPGPGVSPGAIGCYACHAQYQTMDAASPAKTSMYHHVVGTDTVSYTGDLAPGTDPYPTSKTDVFCVSCHTDHNYFNLAKGANLRTGIAAAGSTTTNTDFMSGGTYGVCVSCHSTAITKDTANQASSANSATADPSTITPVIGGAAFDVSAHDYSVVSSFSVSATFNANCSKCHNDAKAKDYQTSTYRFGTHESSSRRIVAALGATVADPMEEKFCYRCHSRAGELAGGKAGNGFDVYGSAGHAMGAPSEYIYANFEGSMVSTHPLSTGRVECSSCHNPHVTKANNAPTDPDNTLKLAAWTSSDEAALCLKCHDGTTPVAGSTDTTFVPVSVTMVKPDMNKSTNAARGHWSLTGYASLYSATTCLICHDAHGSKAPKLLGDYDGVAKNSQIDGVVVTANDNTVCYACHATSLAPFPVPSLTTSGYPTAGTWPGQGVYTTTYDANGAHTGSFHTTATATWPGKLYPGGDCKNCHDVHGTANTYDELRTENAAGVADQYHYNQADSGFCFNCHDGTPGRDMSAYFPTTVGGTGVQTASTRYGHKTRSAGNLPAGSALPCYDCHNPHGSGSAYGLQVRTMINGNTVAVGATANQIRMSPTDQATAVNVRNYCFVCHTTSDATAQGYNGSAMVANVLATDKVEGISRVTTTTGQVLRLPDVNGHHAADSQSCYVCHGNDYSPTGNNVHNPSGGVSTGGGPCYACHIAYQTNLEDGVAPKIGPGRAASVHHVMGGALGDGDIAPNATLGSYPTSQTDVYCVSCHTDHNYFNATKGANLRTGIAAAGNSTANTDFIAGGTGICVSCHATSLAKQNPGTDQASLGAANTPVIGGAVFDASAHDYTVASSFGTSTFNANCSKCHSDEQTKGFQTSTYRFGTHWSASAGILSALGVFTSNLPHEEACLKCHNATSQPYGAVLPAPANATQAEFAMTSKHDLTKVTCENCHNVHAATAAVPAADPDNIYNTASLTTTATANVYCLKCHDGGLPTQTVNGTTLIPWTVTAGASADVDANYAVDGHGSAAASVSCRTCHEQHGSSLVHLLKTSVNGQSVATYSDTVDEAQCLACHRTGGAAASANIARYYPTGVTGEAVQSVALPGAAGGGGSRYGHRTKTAGTMAAGSAVPCRACHNPHGAGNGYGLLVPTQLNGASLTVGATAGQLNMTALGQVTASNVRNFCFSCHTTSDTGAGYNGAGGFTVALPADQVLGISRTGGVLKLPAYVGHRVGDTTYSCYLCHGDDFALSTSANVHNPTGGESKGKIPCYTCHTVYQNYMEDSVLATVGPSRASSYHHVMGNATRSGDTLTYPLSGDANFRQEVFCLSCHVDHDLFDPNVVGTYTRASNLRSTIGAATPTAADDTNTDYNNVNGGVCLSCHSTALTRDNADQKAETNSTTLPIITSAGYNVSAHDYTAPSTFGSDASTFNGNCVKCHDDESNNGGMEVGTKTVGFQSSVNKFSTHYSAQRRILAAMGVALTEPPHEEDNCYKCHSQSADGFKATAGRDWYNMIATSVTAENIYDLMQLGTPQATTSNATLYFRPNTDGSVSGNAPTGDQGVTYYNVSGAFTQRLMAPSAASVAVESFDTATYAVPAGTQNWRRLRLVSPPVASTTNVAAGAWNVSVFDRESSANANAYVFYYIYVWRADNATKTDVVTAQRYATTEMGTTAVPGTVQTFATANGVAVTLNPGDKIVVDLGVQTNAVTTAGNYGLTYSWGTTAPGYLRAPTAIPWTWASSGGWAHLVGSYDGIHRPSPTDETRAYLSANRHVECADCHDVHAAQATRHSRGTNAVSGALQGVQGAEPTLATGNWTSPTGYTTVDPATKEYQICFRCHSGFNQNTSAQGQTTLITWGGTGSTAWTDVGLEFSTSNQSYHPVIAALPATDPGANGSSQLSQAAQLRPAFTVGGVSYGGWTRGSTMYCSDCHAESNAGSLGPHGSSVKWMLKGPNQAWPYSTAAANGSSALTGFRQSTAAAGTGYSGWDTSLDTADGLFCRNCHNIDSAASGQDLHARGDHNEPCVACHIRVPHGGKVSRLLSATGKDATVTGYPGNLPLRYTADGQGNRGTQGSRGGWLTWYIKRADINWQAADCGQRSCGQHSASSTNVNAESW